MSAEAVSATQPDLLNQTLFIADNLNLLRSIDNETVDLICTDPPFAKNDTFVGELKPPLSAEEREQEIRMLKNWGIFSVKDAESLGIVWPDADENQAKFQDIWRWESDVHEDWVNQIEDDFKPVSMAIEASRYSHSEDLAAYLTYMAVRLIEMRRILKPEGTIYIHCDQTASHYLKSTLDAIFGKEHFQNEIIWRYGKMANARERFANNHDTILRYTKSSKFTFNPIWGGDSEYKNRFAKDLKDNKLFYGVVKHRKDKLILRRIEKTKKELGRELTDSDVLFDFDVEFKFQDDVFRNISIIKGNAKEDAGYPTQKPLALYERLIEASSNPGDLVFDPFAGCATTCAAAERQDRRWMACDYSVRALTVLRRQFHKFEYSVEGEQGEGQMTLMARADLTVRSPKDLPERTDQDPEPVEEIKPLPERQYKMSSSIIPEKEMLRILLEMSDYTAWCCGFANRAADGRVIRTTNNFHLDHIEPKSRPGSSNQIYNRAPMCPTHNIRKGQRRIPLDEYRKEIARAGELLVDDIEDLIDLTKARAAAEKEYEDAAAKRNIQMSMQESD